MHIHNIMADYDKARECPGHGREFPMDRSIFRDVAERVIERKRRMAQVIGADDHGRASLIIQTDIRSALDGADYDSPVADQWHSLVYAIRSWLYADDNNGGKERACLRDWLIRTVESSYGTKQALVAAFADGDKSVDTPMFTDSCGRRVRLGRYLAKIGCPDGIWNEYLNGSQGIVAQARAATKSTLILSVNPLDMYFQSSYQHGYTTCHNPYGLRQGGPWQYMADTISACIISLRSSLRDHDVFPFEKDGRIMLYVPDEDHVLLGRGYGRFQGNTELAKHITRHITERLGGDTTERGKWIAKNSLSLPYAKQNRTAAYPDAEILRASIRGIVKEDGAVYENLPHLHFEKPFCATCGDEYEREDDKYDNLRECDGCNTGTNCECYRCGTAMNSDADDVYTHDGDYYCENCHSNTFFTCENCDDSCHNDEHHLVYNRRGYEESWCESCTNDNTFRCSGCDENHHEDRAREVIVFRRSIFNSTVVRSESESYCPSCADDVEECPRCDRHVVSASSRLDALVEVVGTGEHICHDCVEEAEDKGTVVQYQQQYFTPAAMVQFRIDEYVDAVLADEIEFAKKGVMA